MDLLREAGIKVGINCVVSRGNFDQLAGVFGFAAERGLTDVEFLRLKPTGRARSDYFEKRLTPAQNREFYPMIRDLSREHGVAAKIDCSFVPMFCWHRPDKALMEQFSVYGCEAGNVLLGVRSDGRFAGCSFLSGEESIFDLPRLWSGSEHLARLREWPEPRPGAVPVLRLPGDLQGGVPRRVRVRRRRFRCSRSGVPVSEWREVTPIEKE